MTSDFMILVFLKTLLAMVIFGAFWMIATLGYPLYHFGLWLMDARRRLVRWWRNLGL